MTPFCGSMVGRGSNVHECPFRARYLLRAMGPFGSRYVCGIHVRGYTRMILGGEYKKEEL